MTHGSIRITLGVREPLGQLGVQWTCLVCDGIEEAEPGYDAPIPPICSACHRLAFLEALHTFRAYR